MAAVRQRRTRRCSTRFVIAPMPNNADTYSNEEAAEKARRGYPPYDRNPAASKVYESSSKKERKLARFVRAARPVTPRPKFRSVRHSLLIGHPLAYKALYRLRRVFLPPASGAG